MFVIAPCPCEINCLKLAVWKKNNTCENMSEKKSHKIEQRLMLFTSFVKLCATTAGLSGFSIQQSICSPCETSRRSRYPHDVFSIRWNFLCRRCYTKAFLSSTWLWDCSRYKLHFCCDSFATFTVNRYLLTF